MRVVMAGGGSGGHVTPGLAVAGAIRRLRRDVDVWWIGTDGGIEETLVREAQIPYVAIHAGKLNRFVSIKTIRDLAVTPVGCAEALAVVRRLGPDVALTVGGYVAVPVGFAAWATGVPLIVHQQDVVPNLANKLLSPLATCVTLSFARSAPLIRARRIAVAGNPVRTELFHGDQSCGRHRFCIADGLDVVLVLGGSQGARGINDVVFSALPSLLERAAIVHMTGTAFLPAASARREGLPPRLQDRYHPRAFLREELPDALAAADLVISRSGASTVSELAALGKPAILVPLPPGIGGSPQRANAELAARVGAAVHVEQGDLSPRHLESLVGQLLGDRSRLDRMARSALGLAKRDAAERLALGLLGLVA